MFLVGGCGDATGSESSSETTGSSSGATATTSSGETSGGGTRNGDPCGGAGDCGAEFDCVPDRGGAGMVCAATCVPFDDADDCDDGWFCLGETAATGHCTPPSDTGSNVEEGCGPMFYACAEDQLCQAVTGGTMICVQMCRIAMGDADCPAMRTCIDAYDLDEVGACAPT
jgi:hypothetical protein